MSYCRFSEGDVYAYACEGGVQFWVAGGNKQLDRLCNTYDSAYQYAKYLRDECGLDVPSHVIEALRADALEEANHGDGSVVAELVSENDKLRELARAAWGCVNRHVSCDECRMVFCGCTLQSVMRELGIEVKR